MTPRFVFAIALCLIACSTALAQTSKPSPDVRAFELTATPPSTPALKHELLFDMLADRRTGNAAILYLDCTLLVTPESREKAEQALAAYDAKDMAKFAALAN